MIAGPPDMDAVAGEVERFRNRLRRRLVLVAMIAFAAFIAYEILVALIR